MKGRTRGQNTRHVVEDLVVKDREVEGKTETDAVLENRSLDVEELVVEDREVECETKMGVGARQGRRRRKRRRTRKMGKKSGDEENEVV